MVLLSCSSRKTRSVLNIKKEKFIDHRETNTSTYANENKKYIFIKILILGNKRVIDDDAMMT
jgi:hypothetical protein